MLTTRRRRLLLLFDFIRVEDNQRTKQANTDRLHIHC